MTDPCVSLIMAVYNTPKQYLKEAIESILNQTLKNFELIIVNDGSTNSDIEKIVKSYTDKRIKYFKIKNSGAAAARNKKLKKATGKYIAIMDSDDISLPNRFEKEVNFLEKHPEISIVGSNMELFYENGETEKTNVCLNPKILDFFKENFLQHSTVMWRKADFDKYDLRYDQKYKTAEDYDLWVRASRYLNIANIPDVLCRYRVLQNSLSHSNGADLNNNVNKLRNALLDYLTSDDLLKEKLKGQEPKPGFLLPKWIGRICCLFIPKRKNRHNFRNKYVKD